MRSKPLLRQSFFQTSPGGFALGRALAPVALEGDFGDDLARTDVGTWSCDDALTWSDQVYEIFGFQNGASIARKEAAARYLEHSRSVLERMRSFAIKHKCGFILDAEIGSPGDDSRWIRVLAAPILEQGRVVGLRGLKRAL